MRSHGKSGVTFDRLPARQGEGRGWRISALVIKAVDAPHVYLQGPSGGSIASHPAPSFDPMGPLSRDEILREVLGGFETVDYKIYRAISFRVYPGPPPKYEFGLY